MRLRVLIGGLAIIFGCASQSGRDAGVSAFDGLQPTDSTFFVAVVKEVRARSSRAILVDPRPLKNSQPAYPDSVLAANPELSIDESAVEALVPAGLLFPDSSDLAPVPVQVLSTRRAALSALNVEEVDFITERASPCPGWFLPPGTDVDRSGCPPNARDLVVLTLPRPGGAYWPGGMDERDEGLADGHWSVWVTVRTEGPGGTETTVYSLVLAPRADDGWEVVERVPHLVVE